MSIKKNTSNGFTMIEIVMVIVIAGIIELKCMDNENKLILQQKLSLDSCNLVKVNSGTWYGFKGISENTASILAILDGCHDENEIKRLSTNDYQF